MDADSSKKLHSKRKAGPKANKKKKSEVVRDDDPRKRNPKAFALQSVKKVERKVRRTLDIKEKKHHIPLVDRTPVEPPPLIVAIVGPPKVGKTTLMKGLVKNFTKHRLSNVKGPVTVVSGTSPQLLSYPFTLS